MTIRVARLAADDIDAHAEALGAILLDCVAGGASVSFMADLTRERAEDFWRSKAEGVARDDIRLLAAEADGAMLGTVTVARAGPDNQPHRGDVAKMLVHSRARRRGVARLLMETAEREARAMGLTLLVLDTVTGSAAEALYVGLGWQRVGEIPDFALYPDGALCPTTFFYKRLG
ncbi:GNAT family N-acetyltransferase [Sphingomonas cavernae]|uniref:GNAT family N-acetyltransferase n=1 Tax=Sphingomonas cavernae TaxID=2320861 RepID=A0A418WRU1_9SPHN|nr:GNAT family N-acetyltransferase [Sphingomonas cavernae]RJF93879.1 GNAT family N-acetyltransferase [Sphingomonas cavernae]